MTTEEFTLQHKAYQQRAADAAARILAAPTDPACVASAIREYVICKYLLADGEADSDNLLVLGDRSTEKLASLRRGGVQMADKLAGCTTVATSLTKKVLLVLSLKRVLGLPYDPDRVAEIETVTQLAEYTFALLSGGDPL